MSNIRGQGINHVQTQHKKKSNYNLKPGVRKGDSHQTFLGYAASRKCAQRLGIKCRCLFKDRKEGKREKLFPLKIVRIISRPG